MDELARLNERHIPYIVSYDGRTGQKKFGQPLPDFLHLTCIELDAGRSSQATLLGRVERTYESLAMRRIELIWLDDEIQQYAQLLSEATAASIILPDYIKQVLKQHLQNMER